MSRGLFFSQKGGFLGWGGVAGEWRFLVGRPVLEARKHFSLGHEPPLGGPGWERLSHSGWLSGRSWVQLSAWDQISYRLSWFYSVPSGICLYDPSSLATATVCHIITK